MSAEVRNKAIPASQATEESILGACLSMGMSWWKIVRNTYPEDPVSLFHTREYQLTARAIERLFQSGKEELYDSAVQDEMSLLNGDDFIENIQMFIVQLQSNASVTTIKSLRSALGELNKQRVLRRQLGDAEAIRSRILGEDDLHPNEVSKDLRAASISDLTESVLMPMRELIESFEVEETSPWEISTGLKDIDKLINGGFAPGRVYVIGARPKVGKTTLAINMTLQALHQGCVVPFFSKETLSREFYIKMLAAEAVVDQRTTTAWVNKKIRNSDIDPYELEELNRAKKFLKEADLYPVFSSDMRSGFDSVEAICMNLKNEFGSDKKMIGFLDYLQLMVENHYQARSEVALYTRGFKMMATEYEIPFVYLSQINREGADGDMPRSSQMRDSGTIEQDADVIILLNRKSLVDESVPRHLMDAHVALNRNGPDGWVQLQWNGETNTIWNIDDDEGDREETDGISLARRDDDSDDEISSRRSRRRSQEDDDDDDDEL